MSDAAPKISVVIPIYNEEAILQSAVVDLIDQMKTLGYSFEIILAENGSKDKTVPMATALAARFDELTFFSLGEPDYGKALRRAIKMARGEYVLCEEIDLCDGDFHRRAVAILEQGYVDFVVGSKSMAGSSDERPIFRRTGTKVLNGMLRFSLGFKGTDTHGLKAFRREPILPIVDECQVDKDLFASELVIRAERAGTPMKEIPIRILEKRPPSISLTKRVPAVLKSMARLVYAIRIKK